MAAPLLHSNYQVRWKNYKRFHDTDWITIRPLTVLIGPNNSGKSSVLAPLLLMNQTLTSSNSDIPLLTRGDLIDAGSYKSFVYRQEIDRDIFFGVRYHTHEPKKRKIGPVGNYPPGAVEVTFTADKETKQTRLRRYEVLDIYNRPYICRNQTPTGYNLSGEIPLDEMTPEEQEALRIAPPVNFLFSPTRTLSVWREKNEDNDEATSKTRRAFSAPFSHYMTVIGTAYSEFFGVIAKMSYVGPLRERPSRYYRVPVENPQTVGARGEHAPQLLHGMTKDQRSSVNSWIKRFEFGDSIRCRPIGEEFFELCFDGSDECVNIADVGFGASQVVPLIVQAIAAPPESLTLAEQPEIHLNPRLQGLLAELFVEMAQASHRIIVETHSEHLLVRLRTLIAEGRIDADQVALYFVEKHGKGSRIRPIALGHNGSVDKNTWPKGFFDDALREALALAAAQGAKSEKGAT